MKAINWRPKHGVVLVLLVAIGVVVFAEQSCYGRELVREKPRIIGRLPTKMRSVIEMNKSIQRVEILHKSLKSKLDFRAPAAEREYDNLLKNIQKLNDDLKNIKDEIEELDNKKAELLKDMNELEGDKVELEAKIESLESTKKTIMAWFGGGFGTSLTGIILLVLKITSQKKDIKLKQIQIDKIAKEKD